MPEEVKRRISESEKGKHVSIETRKKISLAMTGQTQHLCRNWVGDKIGYDGIHDWLKKNFGVACKWENPDCPGINKNFHWAKIKGKEYKRRRSYFHQLCASCHVRYDRKPDTCQKISESLKRFYKTKQ